MKINLSHKIMLSILIDKQFVIDNIVWGGVLTENSTTIHFLQFFISMYIYMNHKWNEIVKSKI